MHGSRSHDQRKIGCPGFIRIGERLGGIGSGQRRDSGWHSYGNLSQTEYGRVRSRHFCETKPIWPVAGADLCMSCGKIVSGARGEYGEVTGKRHTSGHLFSGCHGGGKVFGGSAAMWLWWKGENEGRARTGGVVAGQDALAGFR